LGHVAAEGVVRGGVEDALDVDAELAVGGDGGDGAVDGLDGVVSAEGAVDGVLAAKAMGLGVGGTPAGEGTVLDAVIGALAVTTEILGGEEGGVFGGLGVEGPVPVGEADGGVDALKGEFEVTEVGTVPGEEVVVAVGVLGDGDVMLDDTVVLGGATGVLTTDEAGEWGRVVVVVAALGATSTIALGTTAFGRGGGIVIQRRRRSVGIGIHIIAGRGRLLKTLDGGEECLTFLLGEGTPLATGALTGALGVAVGRLDGSLEGRRDGERGLRSRGIGRVRVVVDHGDEGVVGRGVGGGVGRSRRSRRRRGGGRGALGRGEGREEEEGEEEEEETHDGCS
jgi:hypothetical protein